MPIPTLSSVFTRTRGDIRTLAHTPSDCSNRQVINVVVEKRQALDPLKAPRDGSATGALGSGGDPKILDSLFWRVQTRGHEGAHLQTQAVRCPLRGSTCAHPCIQPMPALCPPALL